MSKFHAYVAAIVALGVVAMAEAWLWPGPHLDRVIFTDFASSVLLISFVLWAELTPVPVASMWPRPREPTRITVSTVFALSLAFIGGLEVAITAFVLAGIIADFRRELWRVSFNAAHMALSLSASVHAGLAFDSWLQYPVAIVVYVVVNFLVIAHGLRIQVGIGYRRLLAYYLPGQLALLIVTVAFVPLAVALSHRWALIALLALPLLGMRNAIAWLTDRSTMWANRRLLKDAVNRGEFQLLYQPVFSLVLDRTVAAEGLVRWIRPERMYGPSDVLGLAESARGIDMLTRHLIEQALESQQEWLRQDCDLYVSVNVPPRLLASNDFVNWLIDIATPKLIVELVESEVIDDPELVSHGLQRLRESGVLVAIDDFGAGQTSIHVLDQLDVDRLKIDRSLVEGLGRGLQSAVAIAWIHGLDTIAEGVEREDQLQHVTTLGVDAVQGYAIAHPMVSQDLIDWAALN